MIQLALHGMKLPLTMPEAFEVSTAVKAGEAAPTSSGFSWRSVIAKLTPSKKPEPFRPAATNLPGNQLTLKLTMDLYEHLSMIHILHGITETILPQLKNCADIKAKVDKMSSSGKKARSNAGAVIGFIDEIVLEDQSVVETTIVAKPTKTTLSAIAFSLKLMTLRATGHKTEENSMVSLKDALLEAAERDNRAKSDDGKTGTPESSNLSKSPNTMSSVSFEQSSPHPDSDFNPPHAMDSKKPKSTPKSATMEQTVCLLDKALECVALARFSDAFLCLRRGGLLLGSLGEEGGGTFRQFLYLFQAWCCFSCGRSSKCKVLLEVIMKFASLFEQSTLYKWAVELKALRFILTSTRSSIRTGVEEYMKLIKSATKNDRLSACSSSLYAFTLGLEGDVAECLTYAKYAIARLSQRNSVTPIGAIYLFCAGYAAALALDSNSQNKTNSSDYAVARRSDVAVELISITLKKLQNIYKTSQPCLVSLYRALKIKYTVSVSLSNGVLHRVPVGKLLSTQKTNPYCDFVFGEAFLRLEIVNFLCRIPRSTKALIVRRDAEIRTMRGLFVQLGCSSSELTNLPLFRHAAASMGHPKEPTLEKEQTSMSSKSSISRMSTTGSADENAENPNNIKKITRIVRNYREIEDILQGDEFSPSLVETEDHDYKFYQSKSGAF
jgi:hypothetical protein